MKHKDLKDAFAGQRAFIVGNGPSLAGMPLDLLASEHTFSTGRIALLFKRTTWRPAYYVAFGTSVNDYKGFPEYVQDAYDAMRAARIVFAYQDCRTNPMFRLLRNVVFLQTSENGHIEPDEIMDEMWSDDILERVSKYGTSLLVAAQIAAYMGFNPVYFIGCDLGDGHFDRRYIPRRLEICDVADNDRACIRAHEIVRTAGERLGIAFYNATAGGDLGVYPRVAFTELF